MLCRKHLTLLAILGLSLLVAGPFILVPVGQTQEKPSTGRKRDSDTPPIDQVKSTFPVVEYSESLSDPERKAKGQKYGSVKNLNPIATDNEIVTMMTDWEVGLAALPAQQSQLIVVGKVDGAKAFVTPNKASVYSEFEIQIDTIFKNQTKLDLKPTGHIAAEREGGIVRFPSGFEKWVNVGGQAMPTIQNTYLFFLTSDFPYSSPQNNEVYILTAYQLDNGRVIPLDYPSSGTHPIAKYYRGKETSELFRDLSNALGVKRE